MANKIVREEDAQAPAEAPVEATAEVKPVVPTVHTGHAALFASKEDMQAFIERYKSDHKNYARLNEVVAELEGALTQFD